MLQPDQVIQILKKRFDKDYPDWARGGGTWPLKIGLKPPTTAERSADPVACHQWAGIWDDYQGLGTAKKTNCRFPTGVHTMPSALILDQPSHVAALHPQTQQTWKHCTERLAELQRTFPGANFTGVVRRITELNERDYRRLVATITWLHTNPTSGLLLRQLPIEGIDTKWLHRHRVLVLALLGNETADPALPDDETIEKMPQSARRRLHERLGLQTPPELIQIAVLDPILRAQVGGMRHFAASTSDLNQWRRHPHTLIILENKETGYAVVDDYPGTVVLHGHGFNVASYAQISWVHTADTIVYWGDIDMPGLDFVNDLRSYGIPATTVLMDTATLDTFRHLATDGAISKRTAVPHLTGSEAELYEYLRNHADSHNKGILLEQERIPWQHAYSRLRSHLQTTTTGTS